MPDTNLEIVWEFQVEVDARTQFEKIYGPNGEWAQLFRHSGGYRGTTLLQDADRPGRYLTIDRWTSREALQEFKKDHHAEYEALDERCEDLTEREVCIGYFQPPATMI